MPKPTAPDAEFWKFPSLAVRQARQIWITDAVTGVTTVARACRRTSTYYLVRFKKPEKGKVTRAHLLYSGLDEDQIHFVMSNETPAERKRG